MTQIFKKTKIQDKAVRLLSGSHRHIMLYGGSRSGKTLILVRSIVIRACKEKSRHIILRDKFNHAKTSIWMDTLPKVLSICFPQLKVSWSKTDFYINFPNGSEIWIAGLDDAERVEKILGKEYTTIYFNECSQISYSSIQVALTRLAEKNGLTKKVYYDENPPTKRHWSYWLFIKGIDPEENNAIDNSSYASMLMNPKDNLENIDQDYITEILSKMPENQRKRFELGEFQDDSDGAVYYSFDREKNVKIVDDSFHQGQVAVGMDFNVNPMTAVVGYYINKKFYIVDEIYMENSDTYKMSQELQRRGFKGATIYPDSTGSNRKTSGRSDHEILRQDGFRIQSTRNPIVFDRVNNINRLLFEQKIVIDPRCRKLIADLEKVSWKNNEIDKKSDSSLTHISDALGYWCWNVDNITLRPLNRIEIS
jgi:PBSX family phage terminase large subunit